MAWNVTDDWEPGRALRDGLSQPRYCLCQRYFPVRPKEKAWFGELITEVISVDGSFFPAKEQVALTEEQAGTVAIKAGYQVLRILRMTDEEVDLVASDAAGQEVEGFEFCGFDLADYWVSAILNCGSFTEGDYFSKAFNYRELNQFGLVSDYEAARRIRLKLMDEYPDNEHAYCDVFAIWRKITT